MNQRQKCKELAEQIKTGMKMASDFQFVMNHLPRGQKKNLLNDAYCGPILKSYGVTE